MNISQKVVAQYLTSLLTMALTYFVSRYSIHLDAAQTALATGVIGTAAGAVAGYVRKEASALEAHPHSVAPSDPAAQVAMALQHALAAYGTVERTGHAVQVAEEALAELAHANTPKPPSGPVSPSPAPDSPPNPVPVPEPAVTAPARRSRRTAAPAPSPTPAGPFVPAPEPKQELAFDKAVENT